MPAGKDVVVIASGAAWIVMLAYAVDMAPAESTTCTPNEKLPGVPGVPETMPDALSESPCGSAPESTDQV